MQCLKQHCGLCMLTAASVCLYTYYMTALLFCFVLFGLMLGVNASYMFSYTAYKHQFNWTVSTTPYLLLRGTSDTEIKVLYDY